MQCNNGEIIKELILSGAGITLKSACDIHKEIESKEIITLLDDYEPQHETEFYAVYPSERYESPKIQAFIEYFSGRYKGQ